MPVSVRGAGRCAPPRRLGPRHPLALTSTAITPIHKAALQLISIAVRTASKEAGSLAQRAAVQLLKKP